MAWILEQPLVTSIFHFLMTVFLVLVTQPCIVGHAQTQDELVAGFIKTEVEQFRASGNLIIGNAQISSIRVLPCFIQGSTFVPSGLMGRKLNS